MPMTASPRFDRPDVARVVLTGPRPLAPHRFQSLPRRLVDDEGDRRDRRRRRRTATWRTTGCHGWRSSSRRADRPRPGGRRRPSVRSPRTARRPRRREEAPRRHRRRRGRRRTARRVAPEKPQSITAPSAAPRRRRRGGGHREPGRRGRRSRGSTVMSLPWPSSTSPGSWPTSRATPSTTGSTSTTSATSSRPTRCASCGRSTCTPRRRAAVRSTCTSRSRSTRGRCSASRTRWSRPTTPRPTRRPTSSSRCCSPGRCRRCPTRPTCWCWPPSWPASAASTCPSRCRRSTPSPPSPMRRSAACRSWPASPCRSPTCTSATRKRCRDVLDRCKDVSLYLLGLAPDWLGDEQTD